MAMGIGMGMGMWMGMWMGMGDALQPRRPSGRLLGRMQQQQQQCSLPLPDSQQLASSTLPLVLMSRFRSNIVFMTCWLTRSTAQQ